MNKSKIYIVTDAWDQTNGVCNTLINTAKHLQAEHECDTRFVTYKDFRVNFRLWMYKQITLCLPSISEVRAVLEELKTDGAHLHIATEGPLGVAFRIAASMCKISFTTSYHTNFPDYLKQRLHIPAWITYSFLRWFHNKSSSVLVTNHTMQDILSQQGFNNLTVWSRGVDTELFRFGDYDNCDIDFLYVGRISQEKNIIEFLENVSSLSALDDTISKIVVVGDGPDLQEYRESFEYNSRISFVGEKTGADLVDYFKRSKVKVFPSTTDTFGLVILESLSCGTPVVAFDTTGPSEILNADIGVIVDKRFDNLTAAMHDARLTLCDNRTRIKCRQHVLDNYSWSACTNTFAKHTIENKLNEH